ncbi:hypothetical protein PAPYR_4154 [Paratrimastix pyriformis]|uniref:Uncharacterized protein n=1 Tax=Paratrimastix pyriformis TaxID=342808 RepID=A0ABQ8UKM5_9EUKA|nr:hypothetical protein PAPYR_4154 [Paratrimastix pyriformis]
MAAETRSARSSRRGTPPSPSANIPACLSVDHENCKKVVEVEVETTSQSPLRLQLCPQCPWSRIRCLLPPQMLESNYFLTSDGGFVFGWNVDEIGEDGTLKIHTAADFVRDFSGDPRIQTRPIRFPTLLYRLLVNTSPENPLLIAASSGHAAVVGAILEMYRAYGLYLLPPSPHLPPKDVAQPGSYLPSLLRNASKALVASIRGGHTECVRQFVEWRCVIQPGEGTPPSTPSAAANGPLSPRPNNRQPQTPKAAPAGSRTAMCWLVDVNADNALQVACDVGATECVQLLLGHPLVDRSTLLQDPLLSAVELGHVSIVDWLMSYAVGKDALPPEPPAVPYCPSPPTKTPGVTLAAFFAAIRRAITRAARRGHTDVIRFIFETTAPAARPALAHRGRLHLRDSAFEKDPSSSTVRSSPAPARSDPKPLYRHHPTPSQLAFGAPPDKSLLVLVGGAASCRPRDKIPLVPAAADGQLEVVRLMLCRLPRAEIGAAFQQALIGAADFDRWDVVLLLLGKPDPSDLSTPTTTRTPLPVSIAHTSPPSLSRSSLAPAAAPTPESMATRAGVDPTPLVGRAARRGRTDVLQQLIALKPDINLNGTPAPLQCAAEHQHWDTLRYLLTLPLIDPNHGCPLAFAAMHGRVDVVEELLALPATDVNRLTPRFRCTALSWAAQKGHTEVVRVLLRHSEIDVNLASPLLSSLQMHQVATARMLCGLPGLQPAGPMPPLFRLISLEPWSMTKNARFPPSFKLRVRLVVGPSLLVMRSGGGNSNPGTPTTTTPQQQHARGRRPSGTLANLASPLSSSVRSRALGGAPSGTLVRPRATKFSASCAPPSPGAGSNLGCLLGCAERGGSSSGSGGGGVFDSPISGATASAVLPGPCASSPLLSYPPSPISLPASQTHSSLPLPGHEMRRLAPLQIQIQAHINDRAGSPQPLSATQSAARVRFTADHGLFAKLPFDLVSKVVVAWSRVEEWTRADVAAFLEQEKWANQ